MSKSSFIDFKAVKAAITMEQALEHYGLLDRFKRSGDSLSGPCPIHKGENPTQFRISISKNIWNCFSQCQGGGNVLDFIARMEDVTIHQAAVKAIEWFNLDSSGVSSSTKNKGKNPEQESRTSSKNEKSSKKITADVNGPNKPLKFQLDKLDREHPYLLARGLTPETIIDFGVGYCGKGMMAERIAIPIRNPNGEIVAYAGRFIGEPPEGTPKYKLPPGFLKSLELFNIERALKEPTDQPLIIVEGFFGCMNLHQHGYRKVVALMGSTMSPRQEELIRTQLKGTRQIVVMLDENEAGRAGRDDIALRLAKFTFVTIHVFEEEDAQPESLTAEEVSQLLN